MQATSDAQRKLIDRLERSERDLKERIKELDCLYGISKLADDRELSIDDILDSVVSDLIPPAFQFPEVTVARIRHGSTEFVTRGFTDTPWKLEASTQAAGKALSVEVFYLQDKPFIETFEPSLVRDLTTRLKVIIENREEMRRQLLDARVKSLVEANERLEERVLERGTIEDVDPVDRQIMHLLAIDGRMKLVDIGTKLSLKDKQGYSHVGVKNRITKLLDGGVMHIQATVNLRKYRTVVGILLLETRSPEDARQLLDEWKGCPRVLFSLRTVGRYDVMFGVVAESFDALETFIHGCSPKTDDRVKGSAVLVSTGFHEPSFFPTRYFDTTDAGTSCDASPTCPGCPSNNGTS